MTNKTFKCYTDAGHGWLAVKRKVIDQLNVEVSSYSYQRGQTVYLEEDADVTAFVKRFIEVHGVGPKISEASYKEYSPIRSYDYYRK